MKRWTVMAALLVLAAFSSPAAADFGDPSTLGVFFVPTPTSRWDTVKFGVVAFLPFDFWVLTYNVAGGMEAYEFSVAMPAGALVTGGRILPEGATDFGAGEDNFIVGTGGICRGLAGWFSAVKYAGVLFLSAPGSDVFVCLTGAQPSSFANAFPGYLVCNSPGELHTFDSARIGCSIINCSGNFECVVPTQTQSFGALKASF